MPNTQYDSYLADKYAGTKKKPQPLQVLAYQAFARAVGNIDGAQVCDMGCGEGSSTRVVLENGRGTLLRVVGLDNASAMLDRARARNSLENTAIAYYERDCSQIAPDFFSSFDVVTSMWLFHYAKDVRMLGGFARSAHWILKPGGRLVAIIQDKFDPDNPSAKFGERRKWLDEPNREGSRQQIYLLDEGGNETADFTIWCWSRFTYTKYLALAGFQNVTWSALRFDTEARDLYPDWEAIESAASCSVLTAQWA